MIRRLAAFVLMVTGASAQGLVAIDVDIGKPYADYTQPDFNGDGKDDLLFLLPGSPATYEVWYQTADGMGFADKRQWIAPPGTAAVAVVRAVPPAGHDLVYLSSDGARVVPGTSSDGKFERWVRAELVFPPAYVGAPRHWSWGKDHDGDGRDDLVLPGLDSALLVVGGPNGRPTGAPRKLSRPAVRTSSGRDAGTLRIRRSRPRISFSPMLDGHPVPTWLAPDGLHVLPRDGDGFAKDSVNLFPLRGRAASGLGLLRRTDVDLEDLDSDGLADLVLTRTEARGAGLATERRTDLLFFKNLGRPTEKPAQVLLLPGVLSAGPYLADVDGDGNKDLFLSVFAGDVASEVQRRLMGRVTIDYHLYLGTGKSPPFSRSPSLSLQDKLDTRTFESWGIRHRRILSHDWNGDGKLDLVRLNSEKGQCTVEIRYATGSGSGLAFSDGLAMTWKGQVVNYSTTALETGRPVVRLQTPTGVTFIARK